MIGSFASSKNHSLRTIPTSFQPTFEVKSSRHSVKVPQQLPCCSLSFVLGFAQNQKANSGFRTVRIKMVESYQVHIHLRSNMKNDEVSGQYLKTLLEKWSVVGMGWDGNGNGTISGWEDVKLFHPRPYKDHTQPDVQIGAAKTNSTSEVTPEIPIHIMCVYTYIYIFGKFSSEIFNFTVCSWQSSPAVKHCETFSTFPFPFPEQTMHHWASQTSGNCYWHKGSWKSPPGARYNATLQRPCNSTRKSTWNPTQEDIPGKRLWRNSQLLRVMATWLLYLYHSILNFSQRFSWFFDVFVQWSQTSFQASLQSFSNISVSSIRWPGMHQSWRDPTPLLSGVADWTNTLPKTEHRSILVDIYGLRSVHPPQFTSKKRSVWKPWNLPKRNSKKRLWDSKVDCKNWTSEEIVAKKNWNHIRDVEISWKSSMCRCRCACLTSSRERVGAMPGFWTRNDEKRHSVEASKFHQLGGDKWYIMKGLR